MPKDFSDLLQRSPMLQHAHCQSVPKLVGAAMRCIDSGSSERAAHDRPNRVCACRQAPDRGA
jgi:hypothetical protein